MSTGLSKRAQYSSTVSVPSHVRQQRAAGLLDDQAHADGGGQVPDGVALVDELAHDRLREHRLDDEVEVGPVAEALDVLHRAGREVVERVDLPAAPEQLVREVGADEPGAAGDERLAGGDHGEPAYPWHAAVALPGAAPRRSPGRAARACAQPRARAAPRPCGPPAAAPARAGSGRRPSAARGRPRARAAGSHRPAAARARPRRAAARSRAGRAGAPRRGRRAGRRPGDRSSSAVMRADVHTGAKTSSAEHGRHAGQRVGGPRGQRRRVVGRRAGADEQEEQHADRRERPDPVGRGVDDEVGAGAEQPGRDDVAARAPHRAPGRAGRARAPSSARPTIPSSLATSSSSECERRGVSSLRPCCR